MKVTICFDDVKVVVPCNSSNSINLLTNGSQLNKSDDFFNNDNPKVSDIIESAVYRFKKATRKVKFIQFNFCQIYFY
jgi:hypothetical protein